MSATTVRAAIAAALDSIDGLRCNSDGLIREQVSPPEAMVDYEVDYDLTFARGADSYRFIVQIFDKRSGAEAAQKRFDLWRDGDNTSGVKYTIENNAGLAAVCHYARVLSSSPVEPVTFGGADLLRIEFPIEVVF